MVKQGFFANAALVLLLLYTLAHFAYSGVYQPIFLVKGSAAISQIDEEAEPLKDSLANNEPIAELVNPRQYGTVFLFVFYTGYKLLPQSYEWLFLAIGYLCLILSFYFCWKAFIKSRRGALWMLIAWLNFAPLYYILQNKNVESWELFFTSALMLSVLHGRSVWAGISTALGALTKFFPGAFAIYFLFKDRKALLSTIFFGLVVLIISGMAFGPALGITYPFKIFDLQSGRESWGVSHYENNSFKGVIHKIFAGFRVIQGEGEKMTFFFDVKNPSVAFIISSAVQILLLALLCFIIWKKWSVSNEELLKLGVIGPASMLIAPMAAHEYGILLLPSFTILLCLYLKGILPKTITALAALAYLLIGQFLPSTIIMRLLPWQWLNSLLGNTHFTLLESYHAYGLPFLGFLLLFIVFVALLLRSNSVSYK